MQQKRTEAQIKVVIIDGHSLFREGLKRILDFEEKFDVLAEGKNGEEAIDLVNRYRPDVVITDVHLPGLNGVQATQQLIGKFPETKILILSSRDDEEYVTEALQSGASGYLLKETAAENLVKAVKLVAAGKSYLHPRAAHKFLLAYRRLSNGDMRKKEPKPFSVSRPLHLLTRRESEVLQLLADGNSNRSLSEALYISEKTAKNHVSNILQKMGVNDRTQAVVTAIKEGWVEVR